MKYGDECYCMYCKETYTYSPKERYKMCCRQCSLVRDFCPVPDCNEYSLLKVGYIPDMEIVKSEHKESVVAALRIMKEQKQLGCMTYGPVNELIADWVNVKENKDIIMEDMHYLHNHCRECFHKLIGWDGK